jgi:uncharacterized protein (DUF2062 family)
VSWRRSGLYYLKRILRLSGTPYAIAMGAAVGTAVAFTPFIGFHLLITFAAAWMLGGNMIAGVIGGSIFGNPLSYPIIWASTYQLGHLILSSQGDQTPAQLGHDLLHKSWEQLLPILKPMTIGSVPLGLAFGLISYVVVHKAVSVYRRGRSERLAVRRPQDGSPTR